MEEATRTSAKTFTKLQTADLLWQVTAIGLTTTQPTFILLRRMPMDILPGQKHTDALQSMKCIPFIKSTMVVFLLEVIPETLDYPIRVLTSSRPMPSVIRVAMNCPRLKL